jgi:hypothetical protein
MVSSAQTSNKDTVSSYPHVLPLGDNIVSSFVLESDGRDSCPFSVIFRSISMFTPKKDRSQSV